MSRRLDTLKHDDPILEHDPIRIFTENLQMLKTNLGLHNFEPLL